MPVDLRDLYCMWKDKQEKPKTEEMKRKKEKERKWDELLRNAECPKHININKKSHFSSVMFIRQICLS